MVVTLAAVGSSMNVVSSIGFASLGFVLGNTVSKYLNGGATETVKILADEIKNLKAQTLISAPVVASQVVKYSSLGFLGSVLKYIAITFGVLALIGAMIWVIRKLWLMFPQDKNLSAQNFDDDDLSFYFEERFRD